MADCKRYKVAAIDLGTVSSRLVLAQVEAGAIVESSKHTEITDLGEGVDATGRFCEAAVERVLAACRMFVDEARAFGAACICTTCTSAARDASNAALLLDGLRDLGLEPQVIPGEVEARLTFFGVAHDFAGERIIVADSGGGSTELATGVYAPERGVFALEGTRSLDIGCRRVTERFFSALPPADGELAAAAAWAGEQFAGYFESLPVDFERAERLVAVGGTVTTLVALVHELEPYDSSFVHLRELSLEQVSAAIERMSTLDADSIAALPGVQPKRAGVILAGAVVIRELMRAGGYDTLTVSENSLLAGIIVNTALYSINIAVMGGSSLLNLNKTDTVFSLLKTALAGTPFAGGYKLIVSGAAVLLALVFITLFLRTRLGLAIRATGNNPDMVRSSSVNPAFTTTVGLCAANALTGLSGCLMAQSQKAVDINLGTGMVTIALASLLIGGTVMGRGGVFRRAVGVVLGSVIFRLVYTVALRLNMPAFMLKLVSSAIVILAISIPYLKTRLPMLRRRMAHAKWKGGEGAC